MPDAWALGLLRYHAPSPDRSGFREFYNFALSVFQSASVAPTYFSACDERYTGKLTKVGQAKHIRLLESDFADICLLSLVANPQGSDAPGHDSFIAVTLTYIASMERVELSLYAHDNIIGFDSEKFHELMMSAIKLQPWDFGYALSQPVAKNPEMYVMEADNGKLDKEEQRRLNAWYAAYEPEKRLTKIRDVLPIYLVNEAQLRAHVSTGQTLGDFIVQEASCSLTPIDDGRLWLWKTDPTAINRVRGKLEESGILITGLSGTKLF